MSTPKQTHTCKWGNQSNQTQHTHTHTHKHMLINRKQTVTQAVCRDWIILCLSLLNKLLSKFNQTHQALSVSLREAVISVAEAGDENKDKTKNNTTNKKWKKQSVSSKYSENCLFGTENYQSSGNMAWLNAIDSFRQRASSFCKQRAAWDQLFGSCSQHFKQLSHLFNLFT